MDAAKHGFGAEGRLTRRGFVGLGAAGAMTLGCGPLTAHAAENEPRLAQADPRLAEAIAKLRYLTPASEFREFGREKPPIAGLPPERLREIGLDRQTWQLEVLADAESNSNVQNAKVERPLSKQDGTALTWQRLMELAEKHAVRFLKVLTCTNGADPVGMGLWEGVPLREIVWLARPAGNVRRVFYFGYHHDEPKQRFQSSLSIGRVLEDPPGELPVTVCYKLNGQWLSPKGGGPVRLVVPEAYGNKAVKWLQRIVLTNNYQANDTYALWNNDIDSAMKTQARFIRPPATARAGQALPLVGLAQVGISGLSKVQWAIRAEDAPAEADDPYLARAGWTDAEILPPPQDWGGGLTEGKLPPIPLQFDPATGSPRCWPLRYTIVHWAALLKDLKPGRWKLLCRAIDTNGIAQPMPRPFPKSGNNALHQVPLTVEG